MIQIQRANQRGTTNLGWLDSKHSFAFGHGIPAPDAPHRTGFGPLRVINDDRVAPGGGFPEHGHDNMEIVSYVLRGGLAHTDSTGTESVLKAGSVQRMTAGSGIRHAEYNASTTEPVEFLQIWIHPTQRGLTPSYEERDLDPTDRRDRLVPIAMPDDREGVMRIHADAEIHAGVFSPGASARHDLPAGKRAWVHIARGSAVVNGHAVGEGDAVALTDEAGVEISSNPDATGDADILVFVLGEAPA